MNQKLSFFYFCAGFCLVLVNSNTLPIKEQDVHQKLPTDTFVEAKKFKIDTALLSIHISETSRNFSLNVFVKSDECYECSYYIFERVPPGQKYCSMFVDTKWPTSVKLNVDSLNCSSTFHYLFGEYGEYSVNFTGVMDENESKCEISSLQMNKPPQDNTIPILIAFAILLILGFIYGISRFLYETTIKTSANMQEPVRTAIESVASTQNRKKRLGSIDTFRGFCLVVMIFVNYGGGKYWYFEHATWNGLTVADLVFPWFMFIMGVNITLSVDSLQRKNMPRRKVAYKVVRRTLILFALGLTAININTTWKGFRVPGVLQRFAIAYLFGFIIQWAFHKSSADLLEKASKVNGDKKWWYRTRDIFLYWPQWLIVLLLEALWLLLTFLLPVPGCPTGYLGTGGLADGGKYAGASCIGGAAGYIDRWMFGENHIYGYPTAKAVYYPTSGSERIPFDPEGVLGSINGCVIVFLGSQMGKIFLYFKNPKSRIIRWFCWGLFLGIISIILCEASANGGWIPVNKNLWTLTFVTTLSCFAFILMIFIYLIVDVLEWWSGSPFDFVGMNSIFLYVSHQTFSSYIPFSWGADEYSTHAEWLAMNMLGVFYWVLIAYYCFRIKFFVRI